MKFRLFLISIALGLFQIPTAALSKPAQSLCNRVEPKICFRVASLELNTEKFENSLNIMVDLCDVHHMGDACNEAGATYYHKTKNVAKAMEYYKSACDKDMGLGCANLGCFFDPGTKCEKIQPTDWAKAEVLYKKGCDLGFGSGCYNAADHFTKLGRESTEDEYSKFKSYVIKGCEAEHPDFDCCNKGVDLIRDLKTENADKFRARACKVGVKVACSISESDKTNQIK